MSNGDAQLSYRWEWPGDRDPDLRLLARVIKIEKQSEGLFSIRRSPSLSANLPDAQLMTGQVIAGSDRVANQQFALVLPKVEAANISANDYIGLGIVGRDICICISKVPDNLDMKKRLEWLANWKCSSS